MTGASDPLIFCQILSTEAAEAFEFHNSLTDKKYIWLRNEGQIRQFSNDGEIFAVRHGNTRKIVSMCYVTLDGDSNRWELGGLSVAEAAQNLGLGTVLVRYALARTIAEKAPWLSNQEIIAHVHEENQDPRNVLKRVGFEQKGQEVAPATAPIEMKRNADGKVVGDVFLFPKNGVAKLARDLETDIARPLRDGQTRVVLDFGVFGVDNVRRALEEAAK